MQILFLHIYQISIKFSIEKKKKSESYIDLVDRARRKIRSVVSVFLFQGIRIFVETNGPRDQWVAALASNYELLPRERDGGLEQRETKERRVADLRTFARYTIKFTIESNAIRRYSLVGLARYINCRPSGSLVDN